MALPLAARELTRLAKLKRTYALRMVAAALAAAALVVSAPASIIPRTEFLATVGVMFQSFAAGMQMLVITVVAPLAMSGAIAREKEEDTLPILLLASNGSADICLAKALAVWLNCEMIVLSTLPVMATASFLGGISVPLALLQLLIVSGAVTVVVALGLLASTIARSAGMAVVWTYFFAVLAGAPQLWYHRGFVAVPTRWRDIQGVYVYAMVVAAVAVLLAILLLPGSVIKKPDRRTGRLRVALRRARMRFRWLLLSGNPLAQLASTALYSSPRATGSAAAALAILLGAILLSFCQLWVVALAAAGAYGIATLMFRARHHGAMDDLMLAIADGPQLARAIRRVAVVVLIPHYLTLLAVFGLYCWYARRTWIIEEMLPHVTILFLGTSGLTFAGYAATCVQAGMTTRSVNEASGQAVALLLVDLITAALCSMAVAALFAIPAHLVDAPWLILGAIYAPFVVVYRVLYLDPVRQCETTFAQYATRPRL